MTCETRQLAEMTIEELRQALEFHLGQPSVIQHLPSTSVEQRPWGQVRIVEAETDVNMSNVMRIQKLREELENRNPSLSP